MIMIVFQGNNNTIKCINACVATFRAIGGAFPTNFPTFGTLDLLGKLIPPYPYKRVSPLRHNVLAGF